MALNFERALYKIVMELKISPKEHKDFLADASFIAGWFNAAFKKRRSMFAGSFNSLPATATYMSDNVVDVPSNFNCYLVLDLKFPFYTDMKDDDFIYLHSECKEKILGNSLISSVYLQNHLRNDLNALMRTKPRITCSTSTGRSYQLCYHTSLYPISAHTIIATQLESTNNARILFEFLVAIKLPIPKYPKPECVPLPESMANVELGYWVALPLPHFDVNFNGHSFLGRSHVWQMATNVQRQRWGVIVRLFYTLSVANGTLSTIGTHALKHTCINLCEKFGLDKADRPLSLKLMDMMITHGIRKLREVSAASKSGQIVNFEVHLDLPSDCAKTDVLLSKIKEKMNSKNGIDIENLRLLFGLLKQQQK